MPCLRRIRNRAAERAEGLNLPSLTNRLTTLVIWASSCPHILRRNAIRSWASGSSAASSLTIGLSSLCEMDTCGSGTTSCPTNSSSNRRVCLITDPVTRWTLPLRVARSFTLIVISSPGTIPAKKSPGISMQTPGAENDFFAFYCCLVVLLCEVTSKTTSHSSAHITTPSSLWARRRTVLSIMAVSECRV